MNNTPSRSSSSRLATCLVMAGALVHCSSTPTAGPVTVPPPPTPAVVAAPPVDLSAVPVPESLVLTVRTPSPRGLVRHVAERVGLGEMVAGLEEQIPSMLGDDPELARTVDLDGPADVAVYLDDRQRARVVVAFTALALPRAEDALSQGHRVTVGSNGVRVIERTRSEEGGGRAPSCVLAPAFGEGQAARVLCSDHAEEVTPMVPFLTRTLPRAPLAQEAGELVVDVAVEQLRARFHDEAARAADQAMRELTLPADANHPELSGLVQSYVRDQLAPTITRGLDDLASARFSLRFADGALRLHGEASVRSHTAPLIGRVLDVMRDAHPSADVVNRLPPNGEYYMAAAGSIASLRPELDLLGPASARLLLPTATLPAADGAAWRAALAGFFRVPGYNRFTSASTAFENPDHTRAVVATYQLDAPATATVASLRTLVTAMRRPAVARAFNTEWHVNPATLRTPPATGMPAGSFYVVIPIPATVEASVRNSLHVTNQLEILAVPDGNNLWVSWGANTLARVREARAAHPAPAAIAGLTDADVVAAGYALPSSYAQALSAFDPGLARNIARGLQNTPNGNAPLTTTLRARFEGEGATLAGDFAIPESVLAAVGAMLRQN